VSGISCLQRHGLEESIKALHGASSAVATRIIKAGVEYALQPILQQMRVRAPRRYGFLEKSSKSRSRSSAARGGLRHRWPGE